MSINKNPGKILLTRGTGSGKTKLNAFDEALLDAGVGNLNLLKVSSVIPPGAEVEFLDGLKAEKKIEKGQIVPSVYSYGYVKEKDRKAASVLVLGLPEDEEQNGIIFEYFAKDMELDLAEEKCKKMMKVGMKKRGLEIRRILTLGEIATHKKDITCVISLVLMI